MFELIGIQPKALFGQLLLGIINGSFYALLSLGLSIIFGLLNIINFAHGAMYMLGAFVAWILLNSFGLGYWWALLLAPTIVAAAGVLIERTLIFRLQGLDHLYGLLLTFGIALVLQSGFQIIYGSSGLPYAIPTELAGGHDLGFVYVPYYRAWVVVVSLTVCAVTWVLVERTPMGSVLRATIENADIVESFGINVPKLVTLTYAFGVGLAALAGVLVAPIYSVNPNMGGDIIIKVFAIVVIGGMGSIFGSVATGIGMGLIEGLTKIFYPEAASTVIFAVMALVLVVKPDGLFGRSA